jgi:hypothetical protein
MHLTPPSPKAARRLTSSWNAMLGCVALACAFVTAAAPTAGAQQPTAGSYQVILKDGSITYGRLERQDADSVVIVGLTGRIAFARASVRQVVAAGLPHTRADGSTEYWLPDPMASRLVFSPTGRTLAKGEGYFADHWVVLGSAAYGITDDITIGGGGLLLPNSQFWFVTPKVRIVAHDNFNLSAGVFLAGWGSDGTGGIGYLVGTFGGSPDGNLTVGIGNGFAGSRSAKDQLIMIGGERRLTKRTAFISENYFTTGWADALVSYGMRFMGERLTFDLVFVSTAKGITFPGVPVIGAGFRF